MITLENFSEVLKKAYTPVLTNEFTKTFLDMEIEREFRKKKQSWIDGVIESRLNKLQRFILAKVKCRYKLRFVRDFILKGFKVVETEETGFDLIRVYRNNIMIGEKAFKYTLTDRLIKKGVAE